MTPQERQMIDDLFARLAKVETAPRDAEAMSAIMQGLRVAPNAIYALVQTVLVQDEALKQAHDRIEQLEAGAGAPQQAQGGGFLDSMREAVFGSSQSHGSVPNVPPPGAGSRPVWNSGQVLQQSQSGGRYDQGHYDQGYGQNQGYGQGGYGQGGYNQGYGAPQGGMLGGGGGGSFLGTAAAAAAGVVGGSLLLNSFRGMMGGLGGGLGGGRSAFGDTTTIIENRGSPWGSQSNSDLARDAGINDIGSSRSQDLAQQDRDQDAEQDREDDQRAGFFDSANNDDHDSDGFDGDDGGGDSDYA